MSNATLLKAFMEQVWNNKAFDAISHFVAAAYTIHIDTGDLWEGKTLDHKEFEKRLHYSFDAFPDLHFDIQTTIADGDYVAITWIMTGTQLGKIGDIAPTNKSIKTNGQTIYHFKNGKITGHSQVFERTTVMQQLGFI